MEKHLNISKEDLQKVVKYVADFIPLSIHVDCKARGKQGMSEYINNYAKVWRNVTKAKAEDCIDDMYKYVQMRYKDEA